MDGHIKDLWHKGKGKERQRTERYGKGKRWQVRWTDLVGERHTQVFEHQDEATSFLQQINVKKLRGAYIDPNAGKVKFADWGDAWIANRVGDEATLYQADIRWRKHIRPHLGNFALVEINAAHTRAFINALGNSGLALGYQKIIRGLAFQMFEVAMEEELIAKNPLAGRSTRLAAPDKGLIEPWTVEQAIKVYEVFPEKQAALVLLGAFLGLRQGEAFGLAVDDIDFLRKVVTVRRQVKYLESKQHFALPKGRKERQVPLPDELAALLSAHLAKFAPQEVTLPWGRSDGEPITVRLFTTDKRGKAINQVTFNGLTWPTAIKKVGIVRSRTNGFHALRHCFASTFLANGGNIRDLSAYLGHANPGFTLKTYTHLMPDNQERMRAALSKVMSQSFAALKIS